MNSAIQLIDLSNLTLPTMRVQNLLEQRRLFDVTLELSDMTQPNDFKAYAVGQSIAGMCETFWAGSTNRGVFESPMFQLACDTAAYAIGMASEELALQAKYADGKLVAHQVCVSARTGLSAFKSEWSVLSVVLNERQAPCLVWGFLEDMPSVGININPPKQEVLN